VGSSDSWQHQAQHSLLETPCRLALHKTMQVCGQAGAGHNLHVQRGSSDPGSVLQLLHGNPATQISTQ
jgi:hypothetical protein